MGRRVPFTPLLWCTRGTPASLPAVALIGLGLSYEVCETFTVKAAVWVSLPFTLMFAVRILIWERSGSILFHGGIAGHFFTAPCQITQMPSRTSHSDVPTNCS
jgi:hypothetical protein